MEYSSDIGFTDAVKAIQARKGSRKAYARVEEKGGWQTTITPELAQLLETQRSIFLATVNNMGQPYIQHRGGPPGFLNVLDERTLDFVDFKGNRQFITQGNLTENTQAFIVIIDYATRTRVKIWGRATVIEDESEIEQKLTKSLGNYRAAPEQIILFAVTAWDQNCPQHIPQRFDREDVEELIAERDQRIKDLEAQLKELSGN